MHLVQIKVLLVALAVLFLYMCLWRLRCKGTRLWPMKTMTLQVIYHTLVLMCWQGAQIILWNHCIVISAGLIHLFRSWGTCSSATLLSRSVLRACNHGSSFPEVSEVSGMNSWFDCLTTCQQLLRHQNNTCAPVSVNEWEMRQTPPVTAWVDVFWQATHFVVLKIVAKMLRLLIGFMPFHVSTSDSTVFWIIWTISLFKIDICPHWHHVFGLVLIYIGIRLIVK